MNETLQVLKERRSCRRFRQEPVREEDLQQILEAGLYAPSGHGKQSPIMIVIRDREMIAKMSRKLGELCGYPASYDAFYGAPVVVAVLADRSANNVENAWVNDGSLVMGNILNAAQSLGVGGCWIHYAKELFASDLGKEILHKLGITGDYAGVAHAILGYPEGPQPRAAKRRENRIYYW